MPHLPSVITGNVRTRGTSCLHWWGAGPVHQQQVVPYCSCYGWRWASVLTYITVHIPPSASAEGACDVIHSVAARLQSRHPDALFMTSGDLNHAALSKNLLISCIFTRTRLLVEVLFYFYNFPHGINKGVESQILELCSRGSDTAAQCANRARLTAPRPTGAFPNQQGIPEPPPLEKTCFLQTPPPPPPSS
ncbi:hypothetical protein Q8A73_002839 [Channa argus]|nr:hypothetical protein Q8A73_002839 [Channa argus]